MVGAGLFGMVGHVEGHGAILRVLLLQEMGLLVLPLSLGEETG
jgi:hypothetical protein